MTWHNVTVEQYQEIARIKASEADPIEKEMQFIGLMYGLTQKQVSELLLEDYKKKAKGLLFIMEDIPGSPSKYIKANGKTYFVNYRVEKHRFGQYIEGITFSENYIENLHLLMASIVNPVTGCFKKVGKNDSSNHEEISQDMLKAKIVDVHATAVFFYRVFRGSMRSTKDYLILEMQKKGLTNQRATILVTTSIKDMDGFITQKWLPSMKIFA